MPLTSRTCVGDCHPSSVWAMAMSCSSHDNRSVEVAWPQEMFPSCSRAGSSGRTGVDAGVVQQPVGSVSQVSRAAEVRGWAQYGRFRGCAGRVRGYVRYSPPCWNASSHRSIAFSRSTTSNIRDDVIEAAASIIVIGN